jgi:hypothetical protein
MNFEKTTTFSIKHFWDTYSVPSKVNVGTPSHAYYVIGDVAFRYNHIAEVAEGFVLSNTQNLDTLLAGPDDHIYVVFAKEGGK